MSPARMTSIALGAAIAVALFAPIANAQQVVVYSVPVTGTYGNDTASTLYLRPLNNAALGTAYFGGGYPRSPVSYSVIPVTPTEPGILRANNYLASTGWATWQAERQALLNRIRELELRMQELEKRLSANTSAGTTTASGSGR